VFTLRQLEIFLAIAEHEHVTRAAQAIGVSQSAASTALAELERAIGVALFEREGRGLRLNDRGALLAAEARGIVERVTSLADVVRQADDGMAGELRLGASTTIGIYLLPARVGAFRQQHPGARVHLQVANSEQICAWLQAREIDLGLVEGPVCGPGVHIEPWLEDRLTIFCAPDFPLPVGEPLRWQDIEACPWILRESGSGTQEVFSRALETRGWRVEPAMTFGHTEAIKHAVESGYGLGCLSRLSIARELSRGWLRAVEVRDLDLRRTLSIVTRGHAIPSGLHQKFVAGLRESTASLHVGGGI
jgi:DNA-binding transcriptional LysR family regulator